MRTKLVIPVICLLCTSYAFANVGPGEVPFDFNFTAPGGIIPELDFDQDLEGISIFPLTMRNTQFPDGIDSIVGLELELTGLTHTYPDDLDVYLVDPFGETLTVMTDRGRDIDVNGITLIFNDAEINVPPDEAALAPDGETRRYRPMGPDDTPGDGINGLGNFLKQGGGTDTWILVILDDGINDRGSLDSWTLRGTAVPEPVTLSLLALGAMTLLRRRRA